MQIEEVEPTPMRKKILAAVLAVLAVIALCWGGYNAWLGFSKPAMPQTADDIEDLLSDGRYQAMSNAERRPYLDHINDLWGDLDEDGRRRLGERMRDEGTNGTDAMMNGMREMYTNMYLNQTEAARDVMLDMAINAMESEGGRDRMEDEMTRERTPEEEEEQNERMSQMYEMLDSGDAQAMGYGVEFFKMLQERRRERGLPDF